VRLKTFRYADMFGPTLATGAAGGHRSHHRGREELPYGEEGENSAAAKVIRDDGGKGPSQQTGAADTVSNQCPDR